MMKIGIVGSEGYVGKYVISYLKKFDIIRYDEPLNIGKREDINSCDIVFVCVPTPMKETSFGKECDISIVENVISWINAKLIILRSTVPPKTTEFLKQKYNKNILFQPEFIGETVDHPMNTYKGHIILGGDRKDINKAIELYQKIYNAETKIFQCSSTEAELVKYFINSYVGMYVSFCNQFYDICKTFDTDWSLVREGVVLDPRVPKFGTFVFPDNRGFGGKCIPKDMNGIVAECDKYNFNAQLLKDILKYNSNIRKE